MPTNKKIISALLAHTLKVIWASTDQWYTDVKNVQIEMMSDSFVGELLHNIIFMFPLKINVIVIVLEYIGAATRWILEP